MSNDTGPKATWAPPCPKCRSASRETGRHRSYYMVGSVTSIRFICAEGHEWLAEYVEAN